MNADFLKYLESVNAINPMAFSNFLFGKVYLGDGMQDHPTVQADPHGWASVLGFINGYLITQGQVLVAYANDNDIIEEFKLMDWEEYQDQFKGMIEDNCSCDSCECNCGDDE